MKQRTQIHQLIDVERDQQDRQWGDPTHDDEHDPSDWMEFIEKQSSELIADWELLANGDFPDEEDAAIADISNRFLKIAALAVAGLESWQRKAGPLANELPHTTREGRRDG